MDRDGKWIVHFNSRKTQRSNNCGTIDVRMEWFALDKEIVF